MVEMQRFTVQAIVKVDKVGEGLLADPFDEGGHNLLAELNAPSGYEAETPRVTLSKQHSADPDIFFRDANSGQDDDFDNDFTEMRVVEEMRRQELEGQDDLLRFDTQNERVSCNFVSDDGGESLLIVDKHNAPRDSSQVNASYKKTKQLLNRSENK